MTDIALLTGANNKHIHYLTEVLGINNEITTPWFKLVEAAKKAGFNLTIASGFRDFQRQLSIWNRKMTGELPVYDLEHNLVDIVNLSDGQKIHAILTYSALPGTSRHHWGTDVDVYDPSQLATHEKLCLEPWEYQENGPFAPLFQWLQANAMQYGFYFPYLKFQGGIAEEPWHLSYAPLAQNYLAELTPAMVKSTLIGEQIQGKDYILENIEQLMTQYVYNINEVPNG